MFDVRERVFPSAQDTAVLFTRLLLYIPVSEKPSVNQKKLCRLRETVPDAQSQILLLLGSMPAEKI